MDYKTYKRFANLKVKNNIESLKTAIFITIGLCLLGIEFLILNIK